MRKTIETYISGWLESDKSKILSTLDKNCVIIESHGPRYKGTETIARWIENWFSEGGKVTDWSMGTYLESENDVAFLWSFKCDHLGKRYDIDGMSFATFKDGKIAFLKEFKISDPIFDWRP